MSFIIHAGPGSRYLGPCWWCAVALALWVGLCGLAPIRARAQASTQTGIGQVLDQYVRDGFVYYAALKAERRVIDRHIASLAERPQAFDAWSAERRLAYWINAYNALVLRTVIDNYPIRSTSAEFPEKSVMQIPGMFTGREHEIAGQRFTLQAIEQERIAGFGDPRAYLALGRGAVGSPRLRSEPFVDGRLDQQLEAVVADFSTTPRHVTVDRLAGQVLVSAVLGWRTDRFIELVGSTDGSGRSRIERAIVELISPALFPRERAFLDENTYRLIYYDFDWRLNDLSGGRP